MFNKRHCWIVNIEFSDMIQVSDLCHNEHYCSRQHYLCTSTPLEMLA